MCFQWVFFSYTNRNLKYNVLRQGTVKILGQPVPLSGHLNKVAYIEIRNINQHFNLNFQINFKRSKLDVSEFRTDID